jgi:hypothetical protein
MKRVTEIKAGVITSSVGIAAVFLFVLMQGIVLSVRFRLALQRFSFALWVAE